MTTQRPSPILRPATGPACMLPSASRLAADHGCSQAPTSIPSHIMHSPLFFGWFSSASAMSSRICLTVLRRAILACCSVELVSVSQTRFSCGHPQNETDQRCHVRLVFLVFQELFALQLSCAILWNKCAKNSFPCAAHTILSSELPTLTTPSLPANAQL